MEGISAPAAAFLEASLVPPRREEPRLAPSLDGVSEVVVDSAQGDVVAWRLGVGPATLLVHGFADDHSLWEPLIAELAARGKPVVTLDLPGHGRSAGSWGLGPQMADGVAAVAEALGPVDAVVSHSAGAGGVALAIHEGLTVGRVAAIAPPVAPKGAFWTRHAERHGIPVEVADEAAAYYDVAIGPERAGVDLNEVWSSLDLPLLFVHSTDDERFVLSDTEALVGRCRQARFVAVNGLSHRRTARDPDVVVLLADFVTES